MVIRYIITCSRFCLTLLPLLCVATISGVQAQQFQQRYVGDSCPISDTNTIGECKLYKDCPEAFMVGRLPDLCSYIKNDAVICCPPSHQSQPPAASSLSPAPVAVDLRPVGSGVLTNNFGGPRPSQIKCDEYAKLAVNTFSVSPLTLDAEVYEYETPNCDFTTPLIVDGEKAKTGEFPHMAAIGWQTDDGKTAFNCGGMLISDEYVLTAAHCTSFRGLAPTVVRLGDQNLLSDNDNAEPKDFRIAQIITHPEYTRPLQYNDIALIKLSNRVTFSKLIRPACLWQTKHINVTQAVATGWGNTDFAGDKSDELLKVSLHHYPIEECSPFFERNRKLPNGIIDTQICFGNRGSRRDTCQGDSGGPLQVVTPGNICTFHLIALTSFGKSCGIQDSPSVYTRISPYLDWIEPIVWPNL